MLTLVCRVRPNTLPFGNLRVEFYFHRFFTHEGKPMHNSISVQCVYVELKSSHHRRERLVDFLPLVCHLAHHLRALSLRNHTHFIDARDGSRLRSRPVSCYTFTSRLDFHLTIRHIEAIEHRCQELASWVLFTLCSQGEMPNSWSHRACYVSRDSFCVFMPHLGSTHKSIPVINPGSFLSYGTVHVS